MSWDELITDQSTAHGWCEECPHFHARGTGNEEISGVVRAAGDHAAGRDTFVLAPGRRKHSVHVDVRL